MGFITDRAQYVQGLKRIRAWIDELPTTGPVGIGIDTNGHSIEIEDYVNGATEIAIGTFDEGWITQPAESGECPGCDGDNATLVHAHKDRGIILQDCLGCQTRTLLVGGEST